MCSSTLARTHAADHSRAIFDSLLRVKGALFTGEALTDHFRVFRESKVLSCRFVARKSYAELAQVESIWIYVQQPQKL